MMAKVSAGQSPFDPPSPLVSASFVNQLVEMVEWWKRVAQGAPQPDSSSSMPTDIVKVRNLVGGDCDLGDVVQLGEELLDDKDKRYPWFEGNAVDDPAELRWAILLEPIKSGEIGMAIVSGRCLANVTVGSTSDTHATPAAASALLTSGTEGPIEILSPIDSTGPQLLWCRLGGGTSSGGGTVDVVWGWLNEDLTQGGSASMSIGGWDGSNNQIDTGDDSDVWDVLLNVGDGDLLEGTRIVAITIGDKLVLFDGNCEVETDLPEEE